MLNCIVYAFNLYASDLKYNIMEKPGKIITYSDYGRIVNHIKDDIGNLRVAPSCLHALYLLATQSKKYDSHDIPDNIITINSEVILATDALHRRMVRIVLPQDVCNQNDISVYNPLGVACLGAKEGDQIRVKESNKEQMFYVNKLVFQPEKEKAFNL